MAAGQAAHAAAGSSPISSRCGDRCAPTPICAPHTPTVCDGRQLVPEVFCVRQYVEHGRQGEWWPGHRPTSVHLHGGSLTPGQMLVLQVPDCLRAPPRLPCPRQRNVLTRANGSQAQDSHRSNLRRVRASIDTGMPRGFAASSTTVQQRPQSASRRARPSSSSR